MSSPDNPPPTLAPKWSHWALVLRIKRALRMDGKGIRDYVEATQIGKLYHRNVKERAWREREPGHVAHVRATAPLNLLQLFIPLMASTPANFFDGIITFFGNY